MSEKMDGVRAYWDGEYLLSRHCKSLNNPKYFVETFPNVAMDGELWMGRDTWEQIISVLNSKDSDGWKNLKYYVFDLPSSSSPFEERMKELENLKNILPEHVKI